MRSSNDICNVDFQKTMGGYKPSDVQEYLSEVAEDYGTLQRRIAELESANAAQAREINTLKEEQVSVHNLLINAQKLADKTVEDAKAEAVKIVNDAHAAVSQIMNEAESRVAAAKQQAEDIKKNSDLEMQKILSKAVVKSENMITAAHDSVARQQLLFDKLKVETSSFKKELIGIYKKQLEILNTMPDEVPFDAQRAADAMAFEADKAPDYKEMAGIGKVEASKEETPASIEAQEEPTAAETFVTPEVIDPASVEQPSEEVVTLAEPAAELPEDEPEQYNIPVQKMLDFTTGEEVNQKQSFESVEAKEEKKKTSIFSKLSFREEDEEEDFEPRDLFGRKK